MTVSAQNLRTLQYEDGPARRGISDLIAVALVALDLNTVQRSTIRALCPTGRGTNRKTGEPNSNPISTAFRVALRRFEQYGWIKRDGAFIEVIDRNALRTWIASGVDGDTAQAWSLLAVNQAVQHINAGGEIQRASDAPRVKEVRRQELIALKRLMESGPGASHSGGSGSARVIPKGGVL